MCPITLLDGPHEYYRTLLMWSDLICMYDLNKMDGPHSIGRTSSIYNILIKIGVHFGGRMNLGNNMITSWQYISSSKWGHLNWGLSPSMTSSQMFLNLISCLQYNCPPPPESNGSWFVKLWRNTNKVWSFETNVISRIYSLMTKCTIGNDTYM